MAGTTRSRAGPERTSTSNRSTPAVVLGIVPSAEPELFKALPPARGAVLSGALALGDRFELGATLPLWLQGLVQTNRATDWGVVMAGCGSRRAYRA